MIFKKKTAYFIAAAFCLSLLIMGCGAQGSSGSTETGKNRDMGRDDSEESPSESEIRKTVDGMLGLMVQGDFEEAESCFDSGMSKDEYWKGFYEIGNLYAILGISEEEADEEIKGKIERLEMAFKNGLIEGYEIKDVSEEEGAGTARAKIKYGFAPDGIEKFDPASVITDEMVKEAYGSNQDEILAKGTEEEQADALYAALFPALLDGMADYIEHADGAEGEWLISLHEEDGAWKVTGISMV
ncbi:MAG: hypothetical protein Q4A32_09425 [Lachnospiraceae bacterium]|nr:hypothetical protein [Lachnospiraceae bacterium]